MASESIQRANNPRNTSAEAIDDICTELKNKKWTGHIHFAVDKGATGTLEKVDICNLFKKSFKDIGYPYRPCRNIPAETFKPLRFYFDTKAYPPPSIIDENNLLPPDCKAFQDLKNALQRAGHECGCPIICNGTSGKNRDDRVFKCNRLYRTYSSQRKESDGPIPATYRQDSILNSDKTGRRKDGRGLSLIHI